MPWARTTEKEGWFRRVLCSVALKCDITRALPAFVRDRILMGAINRERWLLHPSMAPLIYHPGFGIDDRLPQLIAWVVGHTPEARHLLQTPSSVWLPDGSTIRLAMGESHQLEYSQIKRSINRPLGSVVPIDATYHWAPFKIEGQLVRESLLTLLVWWETVATEFQLWAAWVRDAVSVVTLLPKREGKTLSGSSSEMPGHFWLTVPTDRCDAVETLIHESAHCHLLLEEMHEPLIVESGNTITLYSPLRKTERPLRGAFFAAHAMAHMLAFHIEFVEKTAAPEFNHRIHELTVSLLPLMQGVKTRLGYFTERGRSVFTHIEEMMGQLA